MSKTQLRTMVLRWMKEHQPARLEELNETGVLESVLTETATLMQQDVNQAMNRLDGMIVSGGLTPERYETMRRSVWEQVIETHLPAMSGPEDRLTKEAQRRLDAEEKRLRAKWERDGLTPGERDEVWESVRQNTVEEIYEDLDAEETDR
jgi:hypothetical protein